MSLTKTSLGKHGLEDGVVPEALGQGVLPAVETVPRWLRRKVRCRWLRLAHCSWEVRAGAREDSTLTLTRTNCGVWVLRYKITMC